MQELVESRFVGTSLKRRVNVSMTNSQAICFFSKNNPLYDGEPIPIVFEKKIFDVEKQKTEKRFSTGWLFEIVFSSKLIKDTKELPSIEKEPWSKTFQYMDDEQLSKYIKENPNLVIRPLRTIETQKIIDPKNGKEIYRDRYVWRVPIFTKTN